MMSYRSWGLGSSGAALAVVLAASACGGDDDSTAGVGAKPGKAGTGGKAQAGNGGRQSTGGTAGSSSASGGTGGTAGSTSGGKGGNGTGGLGGTGGAGTSGTTGAGTSGTTGAGTSGTGAAGTAGGGNAGGASVQGGQGGQGGEGGESGASAGAAGEGGSPECTSESDCNDDDACSDDSCESGGVCAHAPVDEDDSDPCTLDECDASTGVSHTPASGAACTLTGGGTGVCSTGSCVPPVCGNGAVEPTEECDGSNVTDLDGCNSKCQSEVSSGPGLALALVDNAYDGSLGSMTCADLTVGSKADGLVDSVKVQLAISHTWLGDLVVKVVSPTGTVVTLMSRPGLAEPADDGMSSGGDSSGLAVGFPISFVDGAAKSAENMGDTLSNSEVVCEDDSECVYAPAAGAATAGTLSAFVGQAAVGTWRVCGADSLAMDTGSIDFVRLSVVQ
jgi:cysteine-rich repeat protein